MADDIETSPKGDMTPMSADNDIVERLRIIHCAADDLTPCGTCLICQAADEIERLRAALGLACGLLSTYYAMLPPDQLMQQFLEEADRG